MDCKDIAEAIEKAREAIEYAKKALDLAKDPKLVDAYNEALSVRRGLSDALPEIWNSLERVIALLWGVDESLFVLAYRNGCIEFRK